MANIKAFGGKSVTRAPKGGFQHPVNDRHYKGGQFCPLYSVSGGSGEAGPGGSSAIPPEILERAVRTEGGSYDTGLRLRGFEVHACPPSRYHYRTYYCLQHPDRFPVEAYQDGEFCGKPHWVVGFTRPDGFRKAVALSWPTEAEAKARADRMVFARLTYPLEVGYKANGRFTTPELGRPWGQAIPQSPSDEGGYAPMMFSLTPAEAARVLAFDRAVQVEWERLAEEYRRAEAERTAAIAHAAALDALPAAAHQGLHGPTECLECGATFAEAGRVRSHGMGCDRCE